MSSVRVLVTDVDVAFTPHGDDDSRPNAGTCVAVAAVAPVAAGRTASATNERARLIVQVSAKDFILSRLKVCVCMYLCVYVCSALSSLSSWFLSDPPKINSAVARSERFCRFWKDT